MSAARGAVTSSAPITPPPPTLAIRRRQQRRRRAAACDTVRDEAGGHGRLFFRLFTIYGSSGNGEMPRIFGPDYFDYFDLEN